MACWKSKLCIVSLLLVAVLAEPCPKGTYPVGSSCWKCSGGCNWCKDSFHCYQCGEGYDLVNDFADWKNCSWNFSFHFLKVLPYIIVGVFLLVVCCLVRCAIKGRRRLPGYHVPADQSYTSIANHQAQEAPAQQNNSAQGFAKHMAGPPQNVVIPVFPDFPGEEKPNFGGPEYFANSNQKNAPPHGAGSQRYGGVEYPQA